MYKTNRALAKCQSSSYGDNIVGDEIFVIWQMLRDFDILYENNFDYYRSIRAYRVKQENISKEMDSYRLVRVHFVIIYLLISQSTIWAKEETQVGSLLSFARTRRRRVEGYAFWKASLSLISASNSEN